MFHLDSFLVQKAEDQHANVSRVRGFMRTCVQCAQLGSNYIEYPPLFSGSRVT